MENLNQWLIETKGSRDFNGTPGLYKKLVTWITVIVFSWIYIGFVSAKFILQNENWLGVWQFPVILVVGAVLFHRYYFSSIMRLDAQYGKGSGWDLKESTTLLPTLKERH